MRKESTLSIMHRGFISMVALCLVLLTSCSAESDFNGNGGSVTDADLTAYALPKEVTTIGTRSSLNYGATGMQFCWDENDKLSVFAEGNNQNKMTYGIEQQAQYSQKAHFTSKDFKLTEGTRYFAISKDESNAGGPATTIPDQRNIVLDFSGQEQEGNASTAHLGKYDFMATTAMCQQDDELHFEFQHLGATLRINVIQKYDKDNAEWSSNGYYDPVFPTVKFTGLEMYSADNSFRQPQRHFNLGEGLQPDNSYKPAIDGPDPSGNNNRFAVTLSDGSGNGVLPTSAFQDGQTNTYGDLVAYIEVPPADLRTTTLGFVLYGKVDEEEKLYYGEYPGFNIVAGKAYNMYVIANPTTDYIVSLKVDHRWKYGNTVTRTTGDPGYDETFRLPTHAYLFFCADGEVKMVREYTEIAPTQWSTVDDISTFDTKTTFATTSVSDKNSIRVYAIAAQNAISHGITTSSTEAQVKALKYAYSNQDDMRDLYSTPWADNATFVGNLKDPMQDVFLYHTAAKVDLQWNNTKGTALTGNVSVNSFQSENLSFFQPTQNGVSPFISGSTSNVSTAITPGTCWNGRQVYYLPQFSNNTYNLTIGTGNTANFEFTGTNTEGGFTSWLRAQKIISD